MPVRSIGEKKPVYFYIDEAQDVIKRDEFIPKILNQLRSQRVGLILAHQRTEQIKLPDVLSALANCAIKYANSDEEASYLAPKLRTTKEFLQSLPRGKFAAFVRDMTPHAIAFSVSKVDFSKHARFTSAETDTTKGKDASGIRCSTKRARTGYTCHADASSSPTHIKSAFGGADTRATKRASASTGTTSTETSSYRTEARRLGQQMVK